ncbi:membrane-spanning 4-domains subfamily A member 13 isoform X2 [Erinaceus europaeus]|uniref:Membrane-spanning 4-domains subfamily A member 13 isoform X2 n=1 Tax=Erinaceus europaeus TaxID=9365 RepID=A0ABM3W6P0_ERIEU|nr:membrane-spanning 4-domains subfamily A member 13 isoform X2 [Erinaceus europaeus]
MALCMCEKISSADCFVLGAIQIMIGIFCFLMWYLLFTLYWGQFEGVFGIYDPVTYKTGSSLWGIFFIISGASIIRAAIYSTQKHVMVSIIANSVSVLIALSILCLTIVELSTFHSVSYRNFGQAKLGRRISSILISFYLMELAITFIYSTIMSANMVVIRSA